MYVPELAGVSLDSCSFCKKGLGLGDSRRHHDVVHSTFFFSPDMSIVKCMGPQEREKVNLYTTETFKD